MKNLKMFGGIVLCVISLQLTAQVKAPLNEPLAEKPTLFTALPEKFTISISAIEKIFTATSLDAVKIPIENNKYLEGKITERLQRNIHLVTVNIILPDYAQALFTISGITEPDGNISWSGRIINIRYADVLILKQEGQRLYLLKEKQSLFLVE